MKISSILVAAGAIGIAAAANARPYSWATSVELFNQGLQLDGDPVDAARSDPTLALGVPENSDALPPPFNFVSLGFGGDITLSFGTPFHDEVIVYETTFGASFGHYEDAALYVGVGPTALSATYYYVDTLSNLVEGVPTSLAAVQVANSISQWDYVKLVDQAVVINYDDADGYDVDGVGVLAVPAPASLALVGLGGLAAARRRR